MTETPDLVEPVIGYRYWDLDAGKLVSPVRGERWGREMAARCRRADHSPPAKRCGCGIHAYHEFDQPPARGDGEVAGVVALWGRLEVHSEGIRAQHARVEALARVRPLIPSRAREWVARFHPDGIELSRGAASLGVPLVARDRLTAHGARAGRPLPPELRPSSIEPDDVLPSPRVHRPRVEPPGRPDPGTEQAARRYAVEAAQILPLRRDEARLLAVRARAGDRAAKQALVERTLSTAVALAKAYRGWGLPLLDLIQEGTLGLVRAADDFHPGSDGDYTAYARDRARDAITQAIDAQVRTIRVPVHEIGSMRELGEAERAFRRKRGRPPSARELAGVTGLGEARVSDLLQLARAGAGTTLEITPASSRREPTPGVADDAVPPDALVEIGATRTYIGLPGTGSKEPSVVEVSIGRVHLGRSLHDHITYRLGIPVSKGSLRSLLAAFRDTDEVLIGVATLRAKAPVEIRADDLFGAADSYLGEIAALAATRARRKGRPVVAVTAVGWPAAAIERRLLALA